MKHYFLCLQCVNSGFVCMWMGLWWRALCVTASEDSSAPYVRSKLQQTPADTRSVLLTEILTSLGPRKPLELCSSLCRVGGKELAVERPNVRI